MKKPAVSSQSQLTSKGERIAQKQKKALYMDYYLLQLYKNSDSKSSFTPLKKKSSFT